MNKKVEFLKKLSLLMTEYAASLVFKSPAGQLDKQIFFVFNENTSNCDELCIYRCHSSPYEINLIADEIQFLEDKTESIKLIALTCNNKDILEGKIDPYHDNDICMKMVLKLGIHIFADHEKQLCCAEIEWNDKTIRHYKNYKIPHTFSNNDMEHAMRSVICQVVRDCGYNMKYGK